MHTGRHSTDWAASTGLWRPLVWWFLCLLLRSVPMWQAHMNMVAIAGSVYLLDIYHMPNTTPSALDIILIDWIFSTTMCERKQCMYLNDNVTQSFRSEREMNSMGQIWDSNGAASGCKGDDLSWWVTVPCLQESIWSWLWPGLWKWTVRIQPLLRSQYLQWPPLIDTKQAPHWDIISD